MELPRRNRGDELLEPGEFRRLFSRLRQLAPKHYLTNVIACEFDQRTLLLQFV